MSSAMELERFLDNAASAWTRPTKREFISFFEQWRRCFEPHFTTGRPVAAGVAAMDEVDARLPADAMLFCEPRYPYLPSASGRSFFAYSVEGLWRVDRELFHAHDVVVAERGLSFSCMYTHEVGAFAEPTFWT